MEYSKVTVAGQLLVQESFGSNGILRSKTVFDPNAKRDSAQSLQTCYITNEKEKNFQYNMRILQVESRGFTPLVFSINEGIGRETLKCYSPIAKILFVKQEEPYSLTIPWIWRRLSFSVIGLIITCIRGSRTFKSNEGKQCTSEGASYSKTNCFTQD